MKWIKRDKYQWHKWFAWYPVKLDDSDCVVWLEYVKRKKRQSFYSSWYDYKLNTK